MGSHKTIGGNPHVKHLSCIFEKIYKANTKEKAESELILLDKKWRKKYLLVIKSWENNWNNLSNFFKYPPEIRRIVYTTNTIEGFNRQLRKVAKNRSIFLFDEYLRKITLVCYK
jgi:transposase-like protein